MATVQKTSLRSVFFKALEGSAFSLLATTSTGLGQQALNTIPSSAPAYGRKPDGTFTAIQTLTSPPGDFDTIDISFLEEILTIPDVLKLAYQNREFYIQRLTFSGPPVSNRALWKQLEHFRVRVDSGTRAQGPNRNGSDELTETTLTLKEVGEFTHLYRTSLSALVTAETEDILSVAGLDKHYDYLPGFPGADRIMVFGADATGATLGEVLYSFNGGGTIAAIATDPSPFTQNTAGINNLLIDVISDTHFRVIASRETDAAAKAMFAYQDFVWVGTTMTAASWNVITIAATANGDIVEKMYWAKDLDRLYVGAAGDIYVSTSNGESDPGAAKFTGANAIAAFARDEEDNVWCVGAANAILRELANNRDTFAARTGPTGGGAFTAIAFAKDGIMFAGNGTSLFKSLDKAGSTNGWISLKNFGADHVVKEIQVKAGASNCLRVIVDDTTPGAGEVWETEDMGNTWRQITVLGDQDGYNGAYFFGGDYNKAVLVGDDDGTTGIIELLS